MSSIGIPGCRISPRSYSRQYNAAASSGWWDLVYDEGEHGMYLFSSVRNPDHSNQLLQASCDGKQSKYCEERHHRSKPRPVTPRGRGHRSRVRRRGCRFVSVLAVGDGVGVGVLPGAYRPNGSAVPDIVPAGPSNSSMCRSESVGAACCVLSPCTVSSIVTSVLPERVERMLPGRHETVTFCMIWGSVSAVAV